MSSWSSRLLMFLVCAVCVFGCVAPRAPSPPAAKEDSTEQQFRKLLAEDDDAQGEADRWIRDEDAFARSGAGTRPAVLQARIRDRLDKVRRSYEEFLKQHPDHARAHLAYGSFLNDIEEEDQAEIHWDRARELNPDDPAAWNNLANYYGHAGPVAKAFGYYEKAISLNPREAVYYQNLATTVYLFRKDAMEHFKCDETEVFEKSLAFYRKARELDPGNFPLATDYAQTFYGIKPMRTEEALKAWNSALAIAHDEIEREGVYVHLARIKIAAARFEEARLHLSAITNAMYDNVKARLLANLEQKGSSATNAAPPLIPGQK